MPFEQKHRALYEGLDLKRFSGAISGKMVIITGGGSGIGAAIAKAFGEAGAAQVHLLGRTEPALAKTCDELQAQLPKTHYSRFVVDVTSAKQVAVFFGSLSAPADILINNAGYLHQPGSFLAIEPEDYWRSFEVNILGVIRMTQAFLNHRRAHAPLADPAIIVTLSTGGALGARVPNLSGNMAAKAGVARLMEEFAVDVPATEARFISVAPGVVATAMHARSGLGGFIPMNDAALAAAFTVFTTSPEAAFLNGRLAWATWDVDELLARREEVVEKDLLRTSLSGLF